MKRGTGPAAALTARQALEQEYDFIKGLPAHAMPPRAPEGEEGDEPAPESTPCSEARRATELHERIHSERRPRAALCLSGGGIRSASFALGVIQGLARHGLLSQFDYLSTVSGGGYVGAWLTAWIHRHPQGMRGVCRELRNGRPSHGQSCSPEPQPVVHLREYTNYLTPRLGILSLDTWTLLATYVRNLLLNWLVLLPLLVVVLLLPRVFGGLFWFRPTGRAETWINALTLYPALALSLLANIAAVLWLPSFAYGGARGCGPGGPTVGRAADGASRRVPTRPSPTAVNWLIIGPMTLAAGIWTVRRAWVHGHSPVSGLLLAAATYLAAGLLTWVIGKAQGRLTLRSLLWLWVPFTAGGSAAFGAAYLLRQIESFGSGPGLNLEAAVCFGVPCQLAIFLLIMTIFVGLTSRSRSAEADDDREWWGRLMGCLFYVAAAWLAVTLISMYGERLVRAVFAARFGTAVAVLASATAGFVGMLGGYSGSSGDRRGQPDLTFKERLLLLLPSIGAKVFVLSVFLLIAAGISWVLACDLVHTNLITSNPKPVANPPGLLIFARVAKQLPTTEEPRPPPGGKPPVHFADPWSSFGALVGFAKPSPTFVDRWAAFRVLVGFAKPSPSFVDRWAAFRALAGFAKVSPGAEGPRPPAGGSSPRYYIDRWAAFRGLAGLTALALAVVILLGRVMNINRLSLHAMYRNRLIRAFLGASNPERRADPFTGFDASDNLPMHHLRRPASFSPADIIDSFELADFWLDKRADFARAAWPLLADLGVENAEQRLEALLDEARRGNGPAAREARRELRQLLVEYLNTLLAWPDLRQISTLRAEKVFAATADPELRAAARQLRSDGSPRLLNRLILEYECATEVPETADAADVAEGRHGGAADTADTADTADSAVGSAPEPRPGAGAAKRVKTARRPLLRRRRQRLFHVFNLALNLVNGQNLAWQQRKAGSFTVSPLHSGFVPQPGRGPDGRLRTRGGYRQSVEYGGGISMGTAVAVSGAAASPNMGYHSSPAVALLMTLFNARLGWWLGNPAEELPVTAWGRFVRWLATCPSGRTRGDDGATWRLPYPRHQLRPLIDEALARTSDDNEYVYLSDGGHFENLGLYEMVRRRCHTIVVSDATCDPKCVFDDLGNAVRKIRTDLGIRVRIDHVRFYPGVKRKSAGKYCAVGTIDYKSVDGPHARQGTIVYVKAALRENAPVDVYNYSETSKSFPHESTSNQWFTESQFESYRALGEECICFLASGDRRRWSWMDPNGADPMDDKRLLRLTAFVDAARKHVDAASVAGAGRRSATPGVPPAEPHPEPAPAPAAAAAAGSEQASCKSGSPDEAREVHLAPAAVANVPTDEAAALDAAKTRIGLSTSKQREYSAPAAPAAPASGPSPVAPAAAEYPGHASADDRPLETDKAAKEASPDQPATPVRKSSRRHSSVPRSPPRSPPRNSAGKRKPRKKK